MSSPLIDDIVSLACAVCTAPMAAVSVFSEDRETIIAACGLPKQSVPIASSPASPLLHADRASVEWASSSRRSSESSSQRRLPANVKVFAAVPLRGAGDRTTGALSVMDTRKRTFTAAQIDALKRLAALAVAVLEGHGAADRVQSELRQRERAERARESSERAYRQLVETAGDIIYRTDRNGKFTYVNPTALRVFGLTESEALGMHYLDVVAPEMRDEVKRFYLRHYLSRERESTLDLAVVTRDGLRYELSQNVQLIEHDGRVTGFQAVARDVTARKAAERALAEREALYRLLAENTTDVITRHSLEGDYLYVSPAAQKILGYQPEEMVGRSIYEFFHPQDLEDMKRSHARLLDLPILHTITYRFRTKAERYIWLESTTRTIQDPNTGLAVEIIATSRDITSRRIAEEALRTSERQFRQIAENIPQALWLSSADRHQILYVSPGYERIWGRPCMTLYERPATFFDAIHPDDRLRIVGHHAQIGTERIEEEFRVVQPDGGIRWVEAKVVPILNERNEVTHLAGIAEDVTLRRATEESLRRSEEFLRQLFESSPLGIAMLDERNRVVRVNRAFQDIFGFRADEMAGRVLDDVIVPEELAREAAEISEQTMHGETVRRETTRKAKDGRAVMVQIFSVPILVGGTQSGIYKIYLDVSERRKAEEALGESEQRLARIVETVGEGITFSDLDGRFEVFNKKMEELTEYSREEANSIDDFSRVLYPDEAERQAALDGLDELLRKGSRQEVETTIRTKSGQRKTLLVSTSLVRFKGRTMFLSAYRDITERKRAEAELRIAKEQAEAATRAKSLFLATMSHEIRTPLNGIIGMTDVLGQTPLNPEQEDYLNTIRISGETLLTIINDILDFSKIESGRIELEDRPVEPKSVIESVLDLLAPKALQKNLDLLYSIDPEVPPFIAADETRLRQILLNLAGNAVKFTDRGEVFISVRVEEPRTDGLQLLWSVRDTGIGIPRNKQDRLFQSFSQVDTSTTRKYGGTGLGLAIAARLVSAMGGRIWVESEEQRGATFFFTIRTRRESGVEAVPTRYVKGQQPDLSGRRVLIVDDNSTNLQILEFLCRQWGLIPRTTASPAEALNWLAHNDPFDLAIVDMLMPEMDGLQFAEEARKLRTRHELPMILFTSAGGHAGDLRRIGEFFDATITKPLKHAEVLRAVGEALTRRTPVPQETRRNAPHPPAPNMGREARILIAEDHPVNQKLLLHMLKRLGFTADVVADGNQVLDALEHKEYDLIFMDVHMPEMDGLEASRRILSSRRGGTRPAIIALTADAMEGDREKCIQAGMDDYMTKPIQMESLRSMLERWIPSAAVNSSAPASPTPAAAELDEHMRERLRKLGAETEPALVLELLESYLNYLPEHDRQLRNAIEAGTLKDIELHAHSLKGSSRNFGLEPLGSVAARMEDAAVQGDPERVRSLLPEFTQAYDRALASVRAAVDMFRRKTSP